MDFGELYNEFTDFVAKGDEAGARKFLVSRFRDFPDSVQAEITLAFFEEGLERAAGEKNLEGEFRKDATTLMLRMERLRRTLEDKKKLLELEGKMK